MHKKNFRSHKRGHFKRRLWWWWWRRRNTTGQKYPANLFRKTVLAFQGNLHCGRSRDWYYSDCHTLWDETKMVWFYLPGRRCFPSCNHYVEQISFRKKLESFGNALLESFAKLSGNLLWKLSGYLLWKLSGYLYIILTMKLQSTQLFSTEFD